MPILDQWDLNLNADDVLRGQGADPNVLRNRRPRLFEFATRALEDGLPLIQPRVLYERFQVDSICHNRVCLIGGIELKGEAPALLLGPAQEVIIAICTIGAKLEERAHLVMETDMVQGLALYGVGSAAVESLANAACKQFEDEATQKGWQSTIPLNPGMIGWPIEDGQPQIFSLLDCSQIDVQLTSSAIMLPMKSISLVIGLGADLNRQGTSCDYCAMHDVCKYKSRHSNPE